jgi:cell division protein FtsL
MRAQSHKQEARVQARSASRGEQPVFDWAAIFSPRMMLICMVLASVLASGLAVIYVTYKNRNLLNELQQLKNERNALQVQWGQLLIEQSTFSLEGRIERKAFDELQMQVPEFSELVMVRYE